jgi:V8-like Glu-specific endopeptidase
MIIEVQLLFAGEDSRDVTFSLRRIAIVAGAIAVAGLLGAAAPRAAAPRPFVCSFGGYSTPDCRHIRNERPDVAAAPRSHAAAVMTERAPATPARYWTRARMAAARDVTSGAHREVPAGAAQASAASAVGARWTGAGTVARSTGRVFFTLNGTDYSCSGSAVASANASVVVTAAHCVSDGAGRWATHWVFVPGYRDGRQPYGRYPARRYFVAAGWAHGGNEDDDIAFVVVKPARVSGAVRPVADVVGGQRIGFGYRGTIQTAFGYPADPPYNGRQLDYCAGMLLPDPYGSADAGIECTMTEGGSGGPWFSGFDPRTGRGTITGVTTFRYAGNSLVLYSADLGTTAKALYEQAQHASVRS